MTWRYAKTDLLVRSMTVTVAARRVRSCLGFDMAQGKISVLIYEPRRAGKVPRLMVHQGGDCQAFVRAPHYIGEHPPAILVPGWAYFTLKGWVDERSMPIEAPWEVCDA